MTFLAVHARTDGATIVTDSWQHGPGMRNVSLTLDKVRTLPSGLTITGVGSTLLLDALAGAGRDLSTVTLPRLARHAWARIGEAAEEAGLRRFFATETAVVVTTRYVPSAGRFIITGHHSADDFAPVDLGSYFVTPSDWSGRPSDFELRFLDELVGSDDAEALAELAGLRALPGPVPPTDDEAWGQLVARTCYARTVQRTRTKALIGGVVTRTELRRFSSPARRIIGVLPMPQERLVEAFTGTLHPIGQLSPCECGSGRRALDCHLVADEPCRCGSDRTFGECCRLTVLDAAEWTIALVDGTADALTEPLPGSVSGVRTC